MKINKQAINNVAGKAEKQKRKNNQRLAQIKSSPGATWCSFQRPLKAERNRETGVETLKICIIDSQGSEGPRGF